MFYFFFSYYFAIVFIVIIDVKLVLTRQEEHNHHEYMPCHRASTARINMLIGALQPPSAIMFILKFLKITLYVRSIESNVDKTIQLGLENNGWFQREIV